MKKRWNHEFFGVILLASVAFTTCKVPEDNSPASEDAVIIIINNTDMKIRFLLDESDELVIYDNFFSTYLYTTITEDFPSINIEIENNQTAHYSLPFNTPLSVFMDWGLQFYDPDFSAWRWDIAADTMDRFEFESGRTYTVTVSGIPPVDHFTIIAE